MSSLAILWRIFATANEREKQAHNVFLTAVLSFSLLFGLADNGSLAIGTGIMQRILYLCGFFWLVYQERLLSGKTITKEFRVIS